MNKDQFNELLAYSMLTAVNSSLLLFQQTHQRPATKNEVDQVQTHVLREAQKLKASLDERDPNHEWAPIGIPICGRADT